MSQENVEVVQQAVSAFIKDVKRGELGRQMGAFLASDIEWCVREEHRPVRGHAAVLGSLQEWFEAMELVEFTPDRFIDGGDSVVVLFRVTMRGRGSGVTLGEPLATTWTVRRGKVVRYAEFDSADDALEAAGLSE